MRPYTFIRVTSAALIMCAGSAAADTGSIVLRSSVRLGAETNVVLLADIAELSGQAEDHAGLVIAEVWSSRDALEIPLRDVRARLDEAGVHWGRTTLSGRSVVVRPHQGAASAPQPMTPISIASSRAPSQSRDAAPTAQTASEIINYPTLRGDIAAMLARTLDVTAERLRLVFDDKDSDILDCRDESRRYEIEPTTAVRGSRIDLTVRIWRDARIEQRRTVSVTPTMKMTTLVLRRAIERGGLITENDVERRMQWVSPALTGVLDDPNTVAGRQTAVRLSEGETLREQHLRREMIVRRGQQVTVRCLVGGTVITVQAEARSDGALGETIQFRKFGERDTFPAVVTGSGEAIVDLAQ